MLQLPPLLFVALGKLNALEGSDWLTTLRLMEVQFRPFAAAPRHCFYVTYQVTSATPLHVYVGE